MLANITPQLHLPLAGKVTKRPWLTAKKIGLEKYKTALMLQNVFVFAAGLWIGKHLLKGISLQKSELLWLLTLQFKNKQLRSQHKSLTLELKCWEQGQEFGDRSPLPNLNISFQWDSAALCPAAFHAEKLLPDPNLPASPCLSQLHHN